MAIQFHDLALRHKLVVLSCRCDGNISVPSAVNNQHWTTVPSQDGSQRALIGIVEIPRVFHCEREFPKQSEVRETVLKRPEQGQLGAMQEMIHLIAPGELIFLYTDRRQHDDRCHALRGEIGYRQDDATPHAEADELRTIHVKSIEEFDEIFSVRAK